MDSLPIGVVETSCFSFCGHVQSKGIVKKCPRIDEVSPVLYSPLRQVSCTGSMSRACSRTLGYTVKEFIQECNRPNSIAYPEAMLKRQLGWRPFSDTKPQLRSAHMEPKQRHEIVATWTPSVQKGLYDLAHWSLDGEI